MARERIRNVDSGLKPWIAAGVVLSVALGVGAYLFFSEASPPAPSPKTATFEQVTGLGGGKTAMKLYFPSSQGDLLVPEERGIRLTGELNQDVKAVVEELIRGPVGGLTPSFPAGSRVKSVYVDDAGIAFVNFSRELQTEYPGGAWTETLTIYSLVNTLTEAFPDQIKAVKILVEGSEIPTLAGHIDASRPFVPRTALNRG